MCHWATLLLLSSSFSFSQKSTLDNQITLLTCSRGNKYILCTWMSDGSMQKWKPVTLSLLQLYSSTYRLMVAKPPGLTIPNTRKMKCTTYCGAVFNTVSLFAGKYTVQGEGFEAGVSLTPISCQTENLGNILLVWCCAGKAGFFWTLSDVGFLLLTPGYTTHRNCDSLHISEDVFNCIVELQDIIYYWLKTMMKSYLAMCSITVSSGQLENEGNHYIHFLTVKLKHGVD